MAYLIPRRLALLFVLLLALPVLGGCRTRLLGAAPLGGDGVLDFAAPGDAQGGLFDLRLPADLATGPVPEACSNIFTLDGVTSVLSAFDPLAATFRDLGRLDCPTGSTPSSMAVNRTGTTVWVEYQDGSFFQVDLLTLRCSPTRYVEQLGLDGVVGMSFSSDGPGATTETLFLGGGQDLVLARRDLDTFVDTRIGLVPSFLELSGTGAGDLWGFFPFGVNTPEAFIARLDKTTAALGPRLRLPTLPPNQGNFTFASWGGAFWIFQEDSGSTTVFRVDAASGAVTTARRNTGRNIIGSGTSVCAPVGLPG